MNAAQANLVKWKGSGIFSLILKGESPPVIHNGRTEPAELLLIEIVARMRTWLDRALRTIDQLEENHVWYRPNPSNNAIGNLILHIVGNLRQWIMGGIGSRPDDRNRPLEFSTTSGYTKRQLRDLLKKTVEQSCEVIEKMPVNRVAERKLIQESDVTLAYAVVMAVSHLALHVGQIQYIGKMLLGEAYREGWTPKETR